MAKAGLRCRDLSGNIIFDTTTETTIYLGRFDTGTGNGSISDNRLYNGEPFVMPARRLNEITEVSNMPTIAIDGDRISWWFEGGDNSNLTMVYGVISR